MLSVILKIAITLVCASVYLLVPGFNFRKELKNRPFRAIFATSIGLAFAYLSIVPYFNSVYYSRLLLLISNIDYSKAFFVGVALLLLAIGWLLFRKPIGYEPSGPINKMTIRWGRKASGKNELEYVPLEDGEIKYAEREEVKLHSDVNAETEKASAIDSYIINDDDGNTKSAGLDPDDLICEVDVYLAYGLFGQAEELLGGGIDRDPTNHEYAFKLLQTQHAQGNADVFAQRATKYHEDFGGNKAPDWETVCNMGQELQPNNDLFASSAAQVQSIGKSDDGSETMAADDFTTDDKSYLLTQSLDPAFAFDESDLAATGDFVVIADEVASELAWETPSANLEEDTSLDFPGFDVAEAGQGSVAEGLTLDLDQLSGDLELEHDGEDLLDQIKDASNKIDTLIELAEAYISMGDKDAANLALGEIVKGGNPAQVSEAETLLRKISIY